MDEPTARLAPAEREHLFAVMRRMAREKGVGIIYISHFLEEVSAVADRVTILRDGRVVERGLASAYSVDDLARLLVGDNDMAGPGAARRDPLRAAGTPMLEIVDLSVAGRPPVNLSVAQGEIVGLAGLIGAGRTRLARAIVGDVESTGRVRLAGRELKHRSPQRAAAAGLVMTPEDRKISGLALAASIEANIEATALGGALSRFGVVLGPQPAPATI